MAKHKDRLVKETEDALMAEANMFANSSNEDAIERDNEETGKDDGGKDDKKDKAAADKDKGDDKKAEKP